MKIKHTRLADGVDLYLGDCTRVLPRLSFATGTADPGRVHVICDPPYEQHMHGAKVSRTRKLRTDKGPELRGLTFKSIEHLRPVITPFMVRACDGWLLAFCTPEGVAPWRDAIEAAGARYKRACVWVKPDAAPQFNGQGPSMGAECFVTAWCGTGVSRWNGGGRSSVFTCPTNGPTRDGRLETEKPVPLFAELVRLFTNRGDTVCDPVMGSGTTGVACIKSGRRFVGIEIDPKAYAVACARMAEALLQTDFFVDVPAPMKQMKAAL